MQEYEQFKKILTPEINAATIGISKKDWDSVKIADPEEFAISIMKDRKYDVLPIIENKEVKSFYHTEKWGSYEISNITVIDIESQEQIYYLTNIKDLLQKFSSDKKYFYFLTNYKEIVGLVSIVNLNSKPVYLYFYSFLVELEMELGSLISEKYTDEEIISILNKNEEKFKEKYCRYYEDKKNGINNSFVEYLYFRDMFKLIKENDFFKKLDYVDKKDFNKVANLICDKRNNLSHPINSIKVDIANDLLNFLLAMEKLKEGISKAKLYVAYYNTDYIVFDQEITIKIDKTNPELDQLLESKKQTNWVYITAYNPMSIVRTEAQNLIAHNSLLRDIEKEYKYFEGEGRGTDPLWKPEKSLLVIGIDENKAKELGKKYGQNAIVCGTLNRAAKLEILK